MPELGEQMYCSQQICIPPTFPYLLRQFAKAAIRTQPNDLLKWATAYFRCLSTNVPPPVKPRLEYPIPKDFHGLTPGWLRALIYQVHPNETIGFRTLWDRWIGACLEHDNLIQILCLGGFTDNTAVPWLKFVALCAAHLTENLTKSMILICEILTEEPEGGSAMMPVDIFLDLYKFLAHIDASVPQTLKNYYFLDKFLGLWEEDKRPKAEKKEDLGEIGGETPSASISEESLKIEDRGRGDDGKSVVSCPSVASEPDQSDFMRMLKKIQDTDMEEEMDEIAAAKAKAEEADQSQAGDEMTADASEQPSEQQHRESVASTAMPDQQSEASKRIEPTAAEEVAPPSTMAAPTTELSDDETEKKEPKRTESEEKRIEKCLQEGLERLRAVQQELMGESDDEIEKFKAGLLAEMHPRDSQIDAEVQDFSRLLEDQKKKQRLMEEKKAKMAAEALEKEEEKEEEAEYEEVDVDAIPGIGRRVPQDLVKMVCAYMEDIARMQHNMVMPRNIRHYECPPLEIINVDI